jgi:hypothetical protein
MALHAEAVWRSPRNVELPSMNGAVVHRTETHRFWAWCSAAFGAWQNVMHVGAATLP